MEGRDRDDRDDEKEQRNGVQVLARAATILRLLAADSSGGLTFSELVARVGPAAHHGAPHPLRARARGLRLRRRRHRAACTWARACCSWPWPAAGPADGGEAVPRAALAASSTRPSTSACWTACTCSSSPSTRRRSARSWSSRASAPGSRPSAPPTARRCSRSCPPTSSSGACRKQARDAGAAHAGLPRGRCCASSTRSARTGVGYDREEHHAGICGVGVAITDIDGSIGLDLRAHAGGALPRGRRTPSPRRCCACATRSRSPCRTADAGRRGHATAALPTVPPSSPSSAARGARQHGAARRRGAGRARRRAARPARRSCSATVAIGAVPRARRLRRLRRLPAAATTPPASLDARLRGRRADPRHARCTTRTSPRR